MKLLTIYILISSVSFQSMAVSVSNFLNIPDLIEHYQFHQTEYDNSFIEFFDLHYGSQKKSHAKDHKEHENLPFQHSHFSTANFFFQSSKTYKIELVSTFKEINNNFNYFRNFDFLDVTDILQPPKY